MLNKIISFSVGTILLFGATSMAYAAPPQDFRGYQEGREGRDNYSPSFRDERELRNERGPNYNNEGSRGSREDSYLTDLREAEEDSFIEGVRMGREDYDARSRPPKYEDDEAPKIAKQKNRRIFLGLSGQGLFDLKNIQSFTLGGGATLSGGLQFTNNVRVGLELLGGLVERSGGGGAEASLQTLKGAMLTAGIKHNLWKGLAPTASIGLGMVSIPKASGGGVPPVIIGTPIVNTTDNSPTGAAEDIANKVAETAGKIAETGKDAIKNVVSLAESGNLFNHQFIGYQGELGLEYNFQFGLVVGVGYKAVGFSGNLVQGPVFNLKYVF